MAYVSSDWLTRTHKRQLFNTPITVVACCIVQLVSFISLAFILPSSPKPINLEKNSPLFTMVSIPDEIWREIFASFESDLPSEQWWMYGNELDFDLSPVNTLLSISRVCKRFHRIVKPLIYRTIFVGAFDDDSEERTARLARELVCNPQLGHYIHAITLCNGRREVDDDPQDSLRQTWLSLDAPISFKKQLWKEISDYKGVGVAPFVLCLAPQVRLVDYTYDPASPCTPWILSGRPDLEMTFRIDWHDSTELDNDDQEALKEFELVQGGIHANYRLSHLEEVRIGTGGAVDGNTPICDIEPVLLHPTLKTLRLIGTSWLVGPNDEFKFPNEPWNLEQLELKDSLFDHSTLETILTRCKRLKWLSMETADFRRYSQSSAYTEWDIELSEIGDVLRRLGHNLEFFSLHTTKYDSWSHCEGRLGSLRDLKALQHLQVILNNFTGRVREPWETDQEQEMPLAEALPPMIQTLHLHWDEEYYSHSAYKRYCDNINGAVLKLLMAAGGFPNLRKICIERHGGIRENGEPEWDASVDGWEAEVATQGDTWRNCIYLTKTN